MRITERRLRSLIRNVIRENNAFNWRDKLPYGRTEDYRHPEGEARKIDYKRAEDLAYRHGGHDGSFTSGDMSKHDYSKHYSNALSEKFYKENDIDLADAYYITQTYLYSPKKEKFRISDFIKVSDNGKVFLKHHFHLIDDNQEIKRSELEDLCFNPEKLNMDEDEF